jgi:Ca-activated chloride channel family protein
MARISKLGRPFLAVRSTVAKLILTVFLFALFASCSPAQTQQGPTIRVTVNRVNVGVTVTDSSGHFISGLRRQDFHFFDNGAEQPITDFLPIEEPAQLVLLVESGPAVLLVGKDHVRAADALLASVSPTDRVAIASYSRTPELLLDFTRDKTAARLALQNLNFASGFGQLNLSASLASTLDWLAPLPGKKTVVLLSTGVDMSPTQNWQIIQQKLNTSDVRILAVSLAGDFRKPAKHKKLSTDEREARAFVKQVFGEADQWLRELSHSTGGRAYFPKNTKEFARAYAEIAQLVRHEYSLAFTPPTADGQIHSLKVKAKHSWYQVDRRQAYLAPPPN